MLRFLAQRLAAIVPVLLVVGILLYSTGGGDISPITGGPFRG